MSKHRFNRPQQQIHNPAPVARVEASPVASVPEPVIMQPPVAAIPSVQSPSGAVAPLEVDEQFDRDILWRRITVMVDLKPEESEQARVWKMKVAVYVLDRVGMLPRKALARLFDHEQGWVNYALGEVTERMNQNWTFNEYINKLIRMLRSGAFED